MKKVIHVDIFKNVIRHVLSKFQQYYSKSESHRFFHSEITILPKSQIK